MTNARYIFELEKKNIINNFINGTENDSALAYALYNDCYPFFHDSFKKYEQYFSIKSDIQQSILIHFQRQTHIKHFTKLKRIGKTRG